MGDVPLFLSAPASWFVALRATAAGGGDPHPFQFRFQHLCLLQGILPLGLVLADPEFQNSVLVLCEADPFWGRFEAGFQVVLVLQQRPDAGFQGSQFLAGDLEVGFFRRVGSRLQRQQCRFVGGQVIRMLLLLLWDVGSGLVCCGLCLFSGRSIGGHCCRCRCRICCFRIRILLLLSSSSSF
uniref:Uncharacterized protein n=1 Tax=Pseudo-nitzschia australis TaxID=44445 RepID=A0A7S4ALQ2_9STRA